MKRVLIGLFLMYYQFSFAQTFEVDTIFYSGPSEKRVDLVILGDGYQESELPQFIEDATNFTDIFFSTTPFKEYKEFFNIIAIKVPSNESGASHPGTAIDVTEPAHPVAVVDNYFGSTFDWGGIHRLLVAPNNAAVTNVLATNFPLYDEVLILVNSPHYGGSGGWKAVSSLASESAQIAIHELGHSFSNLKDEYYAGDSFATEALNMTQEADPNVVKWKNWVGDNGIDVYQHCCGGNSENWYRPHENCKMRILSNPFCAVCIEATIEQIHDLVDLIDTFTPANSMPLDLTTSLPFRVNTVTPDPNTINIKWRLNGELLAENVDSVLINGSGLIAGDNELEAVVEDTTSFLRINNHENIHFSLVKWTINGVTATIDEVTKHIVEIKLYPNPTQDFMVFSTNGVKNEDCLISIQDISGREVFEQRCIGKSENREIDISQLRPGVYLVNFKFEGGVNVTRKIIKE